MKALARDLQRGATRRHAIDASRTKDVVAFTSEAQCQSWATPNQLRRKKCFVLEH